MMKFWMLMLALTATFFHDSNSAHAENMRLTEFHSLSDISGIQGSGSTTIPPQVTLNQDSSILRELWFGEKGDEPCVVKVYNREGTPFEWNSCGSSGAPFKKLKPYGVQRYSGHTLKEIRVCNNSRSNERGQLVKGVGSRWFASAYFGNGVDRYSNQFIRNNCTTWQNWVSCPRKTAAGAVVLHQKSIGGKDSLVGIQLACYKIEASEPITEPAVWSRQNNYWAGGSGTTSGSGIKTLEFRLGARPDGDRYYFRKFHISDYRDKGREFYLTGEHMSADRRGFYSNFDLKKFDPQRSVTNFWPYFFNDPGAQSLEENSALRDSFHFIRSLGVCIDKRGIVNGTRSQTITLDDNNVEVLSEVVNSADHSCDWAENSTCRAAELIVGIRVFVNNDKSVVGLQSRCAPRVVSSIPKLKQGGAIQLRQRN